ncbi:ABC transporter substrate-binding protein [Hoeflea sp. WL0058]|uniref:ABC transporter substrate-binding protein n=1 Tax=Flavimaribacter sediminis TaxID=2865987 RepID=A0AAE2ZHN9_9HYPH|nr:ABC transporter substrate-binding protein [Flavimaribacter sediminis]MBW8636239.1 ABC transporter substrate-binding protein [Flavimaribacter sediminis]
MRGIRATAVAAGLVAACSFITTSHADDTIQIGAPLILSGPGAFAGEASKRTLDMLAEELNKGGGISGAPVEFVYYDTEGKPDVAVRVVNRLVKSDQVDAVLGPIASWEAVAVKQVLERAGVPTLMLSATRSTVDPVSDCVFKLPADDAIVVARVYKYLKENGISKVALITTQDGFGDGGQRELENQAEAAGIEIVFDEKFSMDDTDLAPLLNKIKRTDAQAVINWSSSRAPVIVTNTFRQVGLDLPLIHSHAAISPAVLEGAGDNSEGMLAAGAKFEAVNDLPDSDPQKPVIKAYRDAYEASFGEAPNQFGAGAYDAFNILVDALKRAGTESEALCDAIEQTKGHVGLGGVYSYSDSDHAGLGTDSVVIYQAGSGQWKMLQ